jgi:hypothetical protein
VGLEEGCCGCCPCWLLPPLCCAPSELVGRARGARGAVPAPFAPLLLLPEPLFSLPCAAPFAAAAA